MSRPAATEVTCHRHYRWLGPGNRNVDDQRDLRGAPIDLARILADVGRAIVDTPAATPARYRAIDSVYARVSSRFPAYGDHQEPIEQWIYDRPLVAATIRQPPISRAPRSTQPVHDHAFHSATGTSGVLGTVLAGFFGGGPARGGPAPAVHFGGRSSVGNPVVRRASWK